jgi:CRISPR-associated protein Cas5
MVSEIPGSYYKTGVKPSKHHLCGLFENLLGWHISILDREAIFKDLQKAFKKATKEDLKKALSGSGYLPLVYHLFDVDPLVVSPRPEYFDDYWKKMFRRSNDKTTGTHAKGSPNLDFSLIPEKRKLARKEKNPNLIDDKALGEFFGDNMGGFPFFYSTTAVREYLYPASMFETEAQSSNGFLNSTDFILKLSIEKPFLQLLQSALDASQLAYLGTSDEWVEINFEKL